MQGTCMSLTDCTDANGAADGNALQVRKVLKRRFFPSKMSF
jgi:hypothetical protein